jgi:hypothetical protein
VGWTLGGNLPIVQWRREDLDGQGGSGWSLVSVDSGYVAESVCHTAVKRHCDCGMMMIVTSLRWFTFLPRSVTVPGRHNEMRWPGHQKLVPMAYTGTTTATAAEPMD